MTSDLDRAELDLRETLARNIRVAARAQGIPLNHLADFSAVSRAALFSALGGHSAITLDTLARLAQTLAVSPADLLRTGAASPQR